MRDARIPGAPGLEPVDEERPRTVGEMEWGETVRGREGNSGVDYSEVLTSTTRPTSTVTL